MAQARKILIADPDVNAVRPLTKALRQRGDHVQYAPDGSRALEVAVLRHPDVILFDEHCRLIEARAFVQILLTNPRTDDIPVVVTTGAPPLLVAATVNTAAPLKADVVSDGATITCGIPVASPVRPPVVNMKPPV